MLGLIEKAIPMEKRRIQAKDLWLFASQVGVWAAILLLFPLGMLLGTRNWESTSTSMLMVWQLLRAPLAVYFANFYLLGPYLFFKHLFQKIADYFKVSVDYFLDRHILPPVSLLTRD